MLDKAICGFMRAGHFRAGVYKPLFTPLKKQFENVPTPRKITVGGPKKWIIGGASVRIGVLTNHFEDLKKRLENVT